MGLGIVRPPMTEGRLPSWIRTRLPSASELSELSAHLYAKGLHTVCREAHCPNQGDCASRGTATFLILGDRCTRNCSFCAVRHGQPLPVRPEEADLVGSSVKSLQLRHAVITSVARDDLEDGGASVFANTIRAVRRFAHGTSIEVLIPDFQGSTEALTTVMESRPDVINHNLETVSRLYRVLRPDASYRRSLQVLLHVAKQQPQVITKSGIMVGLGETRDEIKTLVHDLAQVGCTVLTVGQYLQPSSSHHSVVRFLAPEEFGELREYAISVGMRKVVSGPFVRSSYKAGEIVEELRHQRSALPEK